MMEEPRLPCSSCAHLADEHGADGKCLFGPTFYVPMTTYEFYLSRQPKSHGHIEDQGCTWYFGIAGDIIHWSSHRGQAKRGKLIPIKTNPENT